MVYNYENTSRLNFL